MKLITRWLTGILMLLTFVAWTPSNGLAEGKHLRHAGYMGGGKIHGFETGCDCGVAAHQCNPCGACCPAILSALVRGVGSLVEGILCCSDPCRGGGQAYGMVQKGCGAKLRTFGCGTPLFSHRSGSGCGCGAGKGFMPGDTMIPMSPGDPFLDDGELAPPPVPTTEARIRRSRPTSLHRAVSYQEPVSPAVRPALQRATLSKPSRRSVTNQRKAEPREFVLDGPQNPLR